MDYPKFYFSNAIEGILKLALMSIPFLGSFLYSRNANDYIAMRFAIASVGAASLYDFSLIYLKNKGNWRIAFPSFFAVMALLVCGVFIVLAANDALENADIYAFYSYLASLAAIFIETVRAFVKDRSEHNYPPESLVK